MSKQRIIALVAVLSFVMILVGSGMAQAGNGLHLYTKKGELVGDVVECMAVWVPKLRLHLSYNMDGKNDHHPLTVVHYTDRNCTGRAYIVEDYNPGIIKEQRLFINTLQAVEDSIDACEDAKYFYKIPRWGRRTITARSYRDVCGECTNIGGSVRLEDARFVREIDLPFPYPIDVPGRIK